MAQGFNVGRLPFAPGTFGSLLGLLWFAVLVIPGSLWIYAAGTIAGICFSVWCCGQAERILRIADPGSVVLDEIVALPVCFLPWVLNTSKTADAFPSVETLFNREHWYIVPLVFVLFRFFDVVKPFPIGRSQRLPGGWGVTMDDVLAGLATALVSLLFVAR